MNEQSNDRAVIWRPTRIDRRVDNLREALSKVQSNLIKCRLHRMLCIHEQDALEIANEALLADVGL